MPIAPIHRFTGYALCLPVNITTIAYPQHKHRHAIIMNVDDDSEIADSVFPELAKGRAF